MGGVKVVGKSLLDFPVKVIGLIVLATYWSVHEFVAEIRCLPAKLRLRADRARRRRAIRPMLRKVEALPARRLGRGYGWAYFAGSDGLDDRLTGIAAELGYERESRPADAEDDPDNNDSPVWWASRADGARLRVYLRPGGMPFGRGWTAPPGQSLMILDLGLPDRGGPRGDGEALGNGARVVLDQ